MNAIWRIVYAVDRAFSGTRFRMLRRFTKSGFVLLAGVAVSGAMGVDMDSTVAYQAFSLILFLLLLSICFGWFFRPHFAAERKLPRFGTAGKPFEYPIVILNQSRRRQTGLAVIEDLEDVRPKFPEWLAAQLAEQKTVRSMRLSGRSRSKRKKSALTKEAPLGSLPANGEIEIRMQVTPRQRGVLRYRGITIARPDPLGLFRAMARYPLPQTVLILPKRYPLPPIALPGLEKYQEGGVALASSVGQSEEFVSLRDYRRGDPLRHIHWRSWAKTGKPIVKEFTDEFFMRHALVLDTFSEHPDNDVFEEAVSVAASFACTIQTQESLLDLLFVGAEAYCITSGRGLAHADQMLEILASVRVATGKSFATLETLVLNHANSVSGAICVLLAWDEPRRKFVEKLKAQGVPAVVVVILAETPEQPLDLGPMHDEPHRLHTLVLGKIEEGLAKL
jgi:uncharacterized protein (DUF58 family)